MAFDRRRRGQSVAGVTAGYDPLLPRGDVTMGILVIDSLPIARRLPMPPLRFSSRPDPAPLEPPLLSETHSLIDSIQTCVRANALLLIHSAMNPNL